MIILNSRMKRERKTIEAMICLYCHDHHGGKDESTERSSCSRPRVRKSARGRASEQAFSRGAKQDKLCLECSELLDYALARLDRCPFQDNKPTCAKCPVHCYKPDMREKVRVVMRYAGPRMLRRHPVLAVLHLVDGFRKTPDGPRRV
jgi:hypothetical protein